jgi:hypothetical protein
MDKPSRVETLARLNELADIFVWAIPREADLLVQRALIHALGAVRDVQRQVRDQ